MRRFETGLCDASWFRSITRELTAEMQMRYTIYATGPTILIRSYRPAAAARAGVTSRMHKRHDVK